MVSDLPGAKAGVKFTFFEKDRPLFLYPMEEAVTVVLPKFLTMTDTGTGFVPLQVTAPLEPRIMPVLPMSEKLGVLKAMESRWNVKGFVGFVPAALLARNPTRRAPLGFSKSKINSLKLFDKTPPAKSVFVKLLPVFHEAPQSIE